MIIYFLFFLLFFSQESSPVQKYEQEAIRLNDLAGHIRTESDAKALIEAVARLFVDQLPPPWATTSVRHRIAHAEYRAVIDKELVSEDRIAALWNEYARTIDASEEAIITVSEVHALRDLEYGIAKLMWSQGWNRSVWTIPGIYTVEPDGNVAHSGRPLEALRVFYDLYNRPEYLRSARQALKKGVSPSDELLRPRTWNSRLEARVEAHVKDINDYPAQAAENRYIREHGSETLHDLLRRLLDEFVP